jgi:hypothetical protein
VIVNVGSASWLMKSADLGTYATCKSAMLCPRLGAAPPMSKLNAVISEADENASRSPLRRIGAPQRQQALAHRLQQRVRTLRIDLDP